MAELSTKYLGLTLRNPIVIGSSGLTNSVKELVELEQNGAAAVVLKSIFEEQKQDSRSSESSCQKPQTIWAIILEQNGLTTSRSAAVRAHSTQQQGHQ